MKKIIDLSQPIYSGMPVYPGDPPVVINKMFSYEDHGYMISKLELGNHTGTHIDAPSHMVPGGKTLSDFPIDYFCGEAVKYTHKLPEIINPDERYKCLILDNIKVDSQKIDAIIKSGFKIVGFGANCGWTVPLIKRLLENDILLVGKLIGLNLLPTTFYFCAFPLNLKEGDGSPVRAVALIL